MNHVSLSSLVFGTDQTGAHASGADDWFEQWTTTTADATVAVREATPSAYLRADRDVLWRGDTSGEELGAFTHGLLPHGAELPEDKRVYNWISHSQTSSKSVYTSTSRSLEVANKHANKWIYEIHAPWGIDQTASGNTLTVNEQEVSFPGGIKGKFIKKACLRDHPEDCEMNPFYEAPSWDEGVEAVSQMAIDWSRIVPLRRLGGRMPWYFGGEVSWAVGTTAINPVQGLDAFRNGLRAQNSHHPDLYLWRGSWEVPQFARSVVPAYKSKDAAVAWVVNEAQAGGWVYEVSSRAGGFDIEALNISSDGDHRGLIGYAGGLRGDLLLSACRYEKGNSQPVECIQNSL